MRPNYRPNPQWLSRTLGARRHAQAAKASKRRHGHTDLIVRFKELFELKTPESWRESLAANLHSLTARLQDWGPPRRTPFRAVNWIINTYSARLSVEKNPKVRYSLLRLGARILTQPPFVYSSIMHDGVSANGMINALEQENLSMKEYERAFELLETILLWTFKEAQFGARLVCLYTRVIREHCTTTEYSDRSMRNLAECMSYTLTEARPSPLITVIVDDDHALPYIFKGIGAAAIGGELRRSLSDLLYNMFKSAFPADRVTLTTRHYPQLLQALHLISGRALVNFVKYSGIADIFTSTPSLLHSIYTRARHDCRVHEDDEELTSEYDGYCHAAVLFMENALDDNRKLHQLLGYGFLTVARHYASTDMPWAYAAYSETFRQVLLSHPEWRHRFIEWTCHGVPGNLTAELGRSFPYKKPRPCLYIWNEDDSEDL